MLLKSSLVLLLFVCLSSSWISVALCDDDSSPDLSGVRSLGDISSSSMLDVNETSALSGALLLSRLSSMYSDVHESEKGWLEMGFLWLEKGEKILSLLEDNISMDSKLIDDIIRDFVSRGGKHFNMSTEDEEPIRLTKEELSKRLILIDSFYKEMSSAFIKIKLSTDSNKIYPEQHAFGFWISFAPIWLDFGIQTINQYSSSLDQFYNNDKKQIENEPQYSRTQLFDRHSSDKANVNDFRPNKLDSKNSTVNRGFNANAKHSVHHGHHEKEKQVSEHVVKSIFDDDKMECDVSRQKMVDLQKDILLFGELVKSIQEQMQQQLTEENKVHSDLEIISKIKLLKSSLLLNTKLFMKNVEIQLYDIQGNNWALQQVRDFQIINGGSNKNHITRKQILEKVPFKHSLIDSHLTRDDKSEEAIMNLSERQISGKSIDEKSVRQSKHNPELNDIQILVENQQLIPQTPVIIQELESTHSIWLPVIIAGLALLSTICAIAYDKFIRKSKEDKESILGGGSNRDYKSTTTSGVYPHADGQVK